MGPALLVAGLVAAPGPAGAIVAVLSNADVEQALEVGREAMVQEDFGEEWRLPLPDGGEIVFSTPFSRLALAARQAALKGEPLGDKQRQEQIERGKGKIQLVVTMHGKAPDFARWYQPVLRVGSQEVKATFVQNERTALNRGNGQYAARNIYVFPLEGIPPQGTVTLVVRHAVDQKVIMQQPLDLSKMR